ncbi:PepSY domain-containing protein [Thalassospira profundimaris]|uniref:PepSY-associated TM helix domain-containing protein n=1 Tax=Thalassospira profundimaris TaxID=502049 RepID=UPI0011BDDA1D|nr:PepSY-associated TM helix domain-containing protein [Thalassospira profundimaris]
MNSDPAPLGRKQTGKPVKPRWFDWHSWIGVCLGLMLFSICWSGAFAALSQELDWLFTPAAHLPPFAGDIDFSGIFAAVTQQFPHARVEFLQEPLYAVFPASVDIITAQGERRIVQVDPATLAVLGTQSLFTIERFFREYHEALFGFYGVGKFIITVFSLPLMLGMVSALLFYRRWWRRFFELRTGKTRVSFWSSLHKLAGLWSLWFVVLIALTGFWYLFEEGRYKLGDGKFAYTDSFPLAVHVLPKIQIKPQNRLPFETLLVRAQSARPDMRITGIYPNRGGYFYVIGQSDDVLVRDRANKIYLDPQTGAVVFNQHADDLSAYWRWSDMADPLHFGTFGGVTSKIIWFVFGLVLSGLALSGAWLHLKKRQRSGKTGAGWRGTFVMAAFFTILPLASLPIMAVYLLRIGPLIDGQRHMAELPLGVAAFVACWLVLTFAIKLIWLWCCYRLNKGKKPENSFRAVEEGT